MNEQKPEPSARHGDGSHDCVPDPLRGETVRRSMMIPALAVLIATTMIPTLAFGWAGGLSYQIEDVIDAFDEEAYLEKVIVGRLGEDDRATWNIAIDRPGDYWVVGVCDSDCADIDICAEDECDYEKEDIAVVRVFNAIKSLKVEVDMYECDFSFCYYGIVVLRE